MGRPRSSQPPIPLGFVAECFDVRDHALVWRERPAAHFARRPEDAPRFNAMFAGKPARFRGPDGRQMVRLQFEGRTRRIVALKVAWCLAVGSWPRGAIKARDGDERNASAANLILVKAGAKPFSMSKGGKASSLDRRSQTSTALLRALAENPDATVPQLSQLVGRSESCCCVRLAKLEAQGLTCSPKCQAHIRWQLSQAGKELAMNGQPLILDERDRGRARSPMRSPASVRSPGLNWGQH